MNNPASMPRNQLEKSLELMILKMTIEYIKFGMKLEEVLARY